MDFGSLLKMASSVLQSSNSGDSNHDSAMSQIGGLISSLCDDHSAQNGQTATLGGGNESSLPQLLGSIGQALLGGGGEAGSIWGTLFSGMSKGAQQGGSIEDLLRGAEEHATTTGHSGALRAVADALDKNVKMTRAKRDTAHLADAHADSLSAFMQALAGAAGK